LAQLHEDGPEPNQIIWSEESPEARLAKAKHLDAELRRVVADIRQGQRDMFQTMALPSTAKGNGPITLDLGGPGAVRQRRPQRATRRYRDHRTPSRMITLCVYGNQSTRHAREILVSKSQGCLLQPETPESFRRPGFAVLATELQAKLHLLLRGCRSQSNGSRRPSSSTDFLIEHGEQNSRGMISIRTTIS